MRLHHATGADTVDDYGCRTYPVYTLALRPQQLSRVDRGFPHQGSRRTLTYQSGQLVVYLPLVMRRGLLCVRSCKNGTGRDRLDCRRDRGARKVARRGVRPAPRSRRSLAIRTGCCYHGWLSRRHGPHAFSAIDPCGYRLARHTESISGSASPLSVGHKLAAIFGALPLALSGKTKGGTTRAHSDPIVPGNPAQARLDPRESRYGPRSRDQAHPRELASYGVREASCPKIAVFRKGHATSGFSGICAPALPVFRRAHGNPAAPDGE